MTSRSTFFSRLPTPDDSHHILWLTLYIAGFYLLYSLTSRVYTAFFSPLAKFPGPKLRALTEAPSIVNLFEGQEETAVVSLHAKYGPAVRTGPNTLSLIGTAETWKFVHGFSTSSNPTLANRKWKNFYRSSKHRPPSLVNCDNAGHARQRKVVSHAFSDKALREQEPMLKMWAEKLVTKLGEHTARGEKVDMLKMLNCTTFDIMGDLTFAEPLHMLDGSEYVPWVKTIFASLKAATQMRAVRFSSTFAATLIDLLLPRIPALRRMEAEHWRYTSDRVDRRLAKIPDRPDLWTRILEKSGLPAGEVDAAAIDAEKQTGVGLSLAEHYSTAALFMIAGTETTATALSGTLYHLLRNPKYLNALQQELRTLFGKGNEDMHLDELARLSFLEAALKEGIRMYPPVPSGLPREVPPEGIMFEDRFLPEGTIVSIHHLSTYRAESNFAHPYEYRPERWLSAKDAKRLGLDSVKDFANDKYEAFEPFSVGPRNCVGKNLAWHEMRLLLASVLTNFDLELSKESSDWANQKVFTLWEKPELMVRLEEVKAAS